MRISLQDKQASSLERAFSAILTLCAVVLVVVILRREFLGDSEPNQLPGGPEYVANWEAILGDAVEPRSNNRVQLFAFVDMQCPYCLEFHTSILPQLEEEFGDHLEVSLLHFPLEMHEFARTAAIAAECAAEQGRRRVFIDALFAQQDSIGVLDWTEFAAIAGVPDTSAHSSCMADDDSPILTRIQRHIEMGRQAGVYGTPTFLINGWRHVGLRTVDELRQSITAPDRRDR